jgi:hypothetical protein
MAAVAPSGQEGAVGSMAAVYFYGSDPLELTNAMWAALYLNLPVQNITSDVNQALQWLTSGYAVVACGGTGLPGLFNAMCADTTNFPNGIGSGSGQFGMFCDYYSDYNTTAYGPMVGAGATAMASLQLTVAQAQSAMALQNGTGSGALSDSSLYSTELTSVSCNCGTVTNTCLDATV